MYGRICLNFHVHVHVQSNIAHIARLLNPFNLLHFSMQHWNRAWYCTFVSRDDRLA